MWSWLKFLLTIWGCIFGKVVYFGVSMVEESWCEVKLDHWGWWVDWKSLLFDTIWLVCDFVWFLVEFALLSLKLIFENGYILGFIRLESIGSWYHSTVLILVNKVDELIVWYKLICYIFWVYNNWELLVRSTNWPHWACESIKYCITLFFDCLVSIVYLCCTVIMINNVFDCLKELFFVVTTCRKIW